MLDYVHHLFRCSEDAANFLFLTSLLLPYSNIFRYSILTKAGQQLFCPLGNVLNYLKVSFPALAVETIEGAYFDTNMY